jgi:hypothetical protein
MPVWKVIRVEVLGLERFSSINDAWLRRLAASGYGVKYGDPFAIRTITNEGYPLFGGSEYPPAGPCPQSSAGLVHVPSVAWGYVMGGYILA